ncbi:MAG: hypothetical protein JST36_03990 [Bacteroidetes bacterium]|nr:hypothetical protein [Bacteroidota bacterium]
MNSFVLLSIPLATALSGWLGIRLLGVALFRPRQIKHIAGLKLQGVLPKSQQRLATQIGDQLGSNLLQLDQLSTQLQSPEQVQELMPGIERHIDGFLQQRLKEKIPVLAMFLSDEILQTIKKSLLEEIQSLLPQVIGQYADSLSQKLNPGKLIADRLAAISSEQLETLLKGAIGAELKRVAWGAAFLGFLIGLIPATLVALS